MMVGGFLTAGGSILAVLTLLPTKGRSPSLTPEEGKLVESLAIIFLSLGAVLLLWPDAAERGAAVYWGLLVLIALVAAGLGLFLFVKRWRLGKKHRQNDSEDNQAPEGGKS